MKIGQKTKHAGRPTARRLRRLLAVLMLLTLCACGTGGTERDILSYQQADFHATVHGEVWGQAFEAEVAHTAASENLADTLSLTFTAPAALAGITLTVTPETAAVALGEISVDASGWTENAWFDLLDLFSLNGSPLSITAEKERGITTVVLETTDGQAVTLTLDAKSGLPTAIECDGIWVEIVTIRS